MLITILFNNSHKYQQLPLIPVEEFLEEFPDRADDDENALMFARIEHERAEREALEQQLQRSAEHASVGLPRPPEEPQVQEISIAVAGQLNGKSLPIAGASDALAQL